MSVRHDQGTEASPDPWAYLDEFVAANEVRHRGGQHVGTIRFPLVPSVTRELRSIFAAVRAAVEAAHQQEIARVCEFARNEVAEGAAERLKLVEQHQQEMARLMRERDEARAEVETVYRLTERAIDDARAERDAYRRNASLAERKRAEKAEAERDALAAQSRGCGRRCNDWPTATGR